MKKAESIEEIYQVFAPEKYLQKGDEEFYVNLYNKDLQRFVNELIKNPIPSKSFFIAGQSGNGKSTILSLLDTEHPTIKTKYELRYLSGKELFKYNDINIIDLLLMIGANLIQESEVLQEKYFESLNKLQASHDGLLQIESTNTNNKTKEGKASASLGLNINFLNIFKTETTLETSYNENNALRETARKIFKTKESDLIRLINEIILDYKVAEGDSKDILLVIDDLEKKENIDALFLKELQHLDSINITKIITMPIHLRRSETFQSKDVREFALKLNNFDDDPNNEDRELLKEVVNSRIANPELIDNNAIDTAIKYSGGNLRQLIRLVQLSANEADTFGAIKIEDKEISFAIEFLQRGLSSPTMMMQTFLNEILKYKVLTSDTPESLQSLGKAIKMGLVFAYFNGKIWYEINPIIKEIIKDYEQSSN